MNRPVIMLALLALVPCTAHGQYAAFVPGTRVQITRGQASRPIIGTVIAQRGDSLILRNDRAGERVSVALSSIGQLQIGHKGQNGYLVLAKAGAGLLVGAAAGAVAGPLFTGACLSSNKDPEHLAGCSAALMEGEGSGHAAVLGGLGGALIGAVAGLVTGAERWEAVDITPRS